MVYQHMYLRTQHTTRMPYVIIITGSQQSKATQDESMHTQNSSFVRQEKEGKRYA